MLGITWVHRKTNEWIREESEVIDISRYSEGSEGEEVDLGL